MYRAEFAGEYVMHGNSQESPYHDYAEEYPREFVLAALAGFFLCLLLLGCLLLCARAGGVVSTVGGITFGLRTFEEEISARRETLGHLGPGGGTRRDRVRLLTDEQVDALPIIQYNSGVAPTDDSFAGRALVKTKSMPISNNAVQSFSERRTTSMIYGEEYPSHHTFLTCDICIDEYVDGEQLMELPCGHLYHAECVRPWLTKRSSHCPHCRADVLEHSGSILALEASQNQHTDGLGVNYGSTDTNIALLRNLRDAWDSFSSRSSTGFEEHDDNNADGESNRLLQDG